jgi:hypothetical protein
VAPEGLTPRVLAEVFSHDVAAIFGDIHVDAHLARECPVEGNHHEHAHGECGHEHPERGGAGADRAAGGAP